MDNKKEQEAYKNLKNNAYGRSFEQGIEFACKHYIDDGLAAVSKTPEPFRVLKKFKGGIFRGQFTARAHPDFKGTVKGGRSIIFEAKYTSTEVMKKKVVTEKQAEVLDEHLKLGAIAGVCVGIQDRYFFVPWDIWRNMKEIIGKQSARVEDLKEWEVPWRKGVMFLENIKGKLDG